ncbi:hypothetical protein DERF_008468 [Dermatophagoides farinae]|uniref:Uncharacterized protein n=1 Tax=Dermatophagoides farinae TaxID=6954 RepID=A0A922I2H6_DERFA|nr:hypothetical protein DERF_008468 [Dermatophagoides farinae]
MNSNNIITTNRMQNQVLLNDNSLSSSSTTTMAKFITFSSSSSSSSSTTSSSSYENANTKKSIFESFKYHIICIICLLQFLFVISYAKRAFTVVVDLMYGDHWDCNRSQVAIIIVVVVGGGCGGQVISNGTSNESYPNDLKYHQNRKN